MHSRFPVQWQVDVFVPGFSSDQRFSALACNLSEGGIQVRCNHQQEQLLISHSYHHPKCCIRIPLADSNELVEVQCRLVFNRRCSQDCYQLGLKILQFYGDSQTRLLEYLERMELQHRNSWC